MESLLGEVPKWGSWPSSPGLGIICGRLDEAGNGVVGVDIDVRHDAAAEEIDALALAMLGKAPVRIGSFPKRLRVYRCRSPLAKSFSGKFTLPDDQDGDKPHMVELCASGQQFVAYGIHPGTRKPYFWPEDGIVGLTVADLTEVTAEALAAFLRAADEVFVKHGGTPVASHGRGATGARPKRAASELRAPDADELLEAFNVVRNDNLPRHEWVAFAYRLKGALEVAADVPVQTSPAVRRRQVGNSAVGYRKIIRDPNASDKDQTTQRNNADKIRRLMEVRSEQLMREGHGEADCLFIVPNALEKELRQPGLPDNVALGHHNGLRGVDLYGKVAYIALISRTLPQPGEVERMAWAISGKVGKSLDGAWYHETLVGRLMRDGSGRTATALRHPDPLAELVRWAICEGELLQLEARARAIRRDARSPLLVDIITDVPLPLVIDEEITWESWCDEAGPLSLMMARGIVPADWKGTAQVLADMFDSADAARMWFQRSQKEDERRTALLNNERTPIDIYTYRSSFVIRSPIWHRWHFRRADKRKGAVVMMREDLPDPRGIAERYFGPLDRWELEYAPQPMRSPIVEDRPPPSAWPWPNTENARFAPIAEFSIGGMPLLPSSVRLPSGTKEAVTIEDAGSLFDLAGVCSRLPTRTPHALSQEISH